MFSPGAPIIRGWVGGVSTPSDARGEPWVAVPTVARLAREAGVLIRENCAIRALETTAGKVHGVVTEDGPVACEQVVLAGGAWSSIFARRHGIQIPQLTVRATVSQTAPMSELSTGCTVDEELALRRRADGGFTMALADKHGFYPGPDGLRHARTYLPLLKNSWNDIDLHAVTPRGFPDGWLTPRSWSPDQASPFEATRVLEPAPNQRYVNLAIDRFVKRFPGVGRPKIVTSWAGMVDAMPDVVPIVDRVSSIDGLIIATGMSGHGFGIGAGFGRIIARMVVGENSEHDIGRFRLNRFSDGSPLEMGPAL